MSYSYPENMVLYGFLLLVVKTQFWKCISVLIMTLWRLSLHFCNLKTSFASPYTYQYLFVVLWQNLIPC